ncbi:unnamed protein product [Rotaria sp. Silwood2]|nr:unnamed protein product [Rotaria sp. Silwood2]CAF2566312.1 unnamed protein product [Rotaria sp. Silwood2]CAF4145158.1 unnamed protein product [Rotaria sp. Silwood2]CAF4460686.1 unnamed protein product [Rotaria sp. Silwood2]
MVGFDAKNLHILDTKCICPVCLLILRDPVQLTECGHRQCQTCVNVEQETTIKCRQCQVETLPTHVRVDRGFKNDMKSLSIDCCFCQWTGVLDNYQEHLDQCHSNLKCDYYGNQLNSVNKFNEHKVFKCQQLTVDCELKDFGCNERIIRSKMKDHYLTQQHQHTVVKAVIQMLSQLNDRQVDIDLPRTTTAEVRNPATTQLEKVYEVLNILANGMEISTNYQQRVSNLSLSTLTEELSTVKLSIEESIAFLEGVKHNQDLVSLQEQIDDLQYASCDGTFLWKIKNFQDKTIDAQSERETSIDSPPFYSSPTGYKMRARLYLNGDGNARRTHMSLFFALMQGEYDAIIKFPFTYKVTFCLYDQTPQQQHIIDSFRPDIKSSSFQRPRSDMNIAAGIPKFIPLEIVQQEGNPYVRDDTMFIKIMVDFGEIPKTLLPYALSLNSGLPSHVQQTMIDIEAKKRSE